MKLGTCTDEPSGKGRCILETTREPGGIHESGAAESRLGIATGRIEKGSRRHQISQSSAHSPRRSLLHRAGSKCVVEEVSTPDPGPIVIREDARDQVARELVVGTHNHRAQPALAAG